VPRQLVCQHQQQLIYWQAQTLSPGFHPRDPSHPRNPCPVDHQPSSFGKCEHFWFTRAYHCPSLLRAFIVH
jgi:hypothetical protein